MKRILFGFVFAISLICFLQGLSAEGIDDFKDIAEDQWYYNSVSCVVDEGLFCGTAANTFSPNTAMSRAMFVTVLGRFDGDGSELPPAASVSSFSDVDENAYYAPYVARAAENDIVKGTGDGRFEPNRALTREEMAVILMRYARYAAIPSLPTLAGLNDFDDADAISPYAAESLDWCVGQGLLRGNEANQLNPKSFVSRAQAAQIFYYLGGSIFRFDADKTEKITVTDQNTGEVYTIEGADKVQSCVEKINVLSFTAKGFEEPAEGGSAVLRFYGNDRVLPETVCFRNEHTILYRGYAYTAENALTELFPNWPEVTMTSAPFNFDQISRITVRNGTTGQLREIADEKDREEILAILNEFQYDSVHDTVPTDGWSYRLTLYGTEDDIVADCVFLNDSEMNLAGKTYTAATEHYFAPLWLIMAK